MMYVRTLILFSVIYVSIEFFAGFFGMDSTHLLAGLALFLACRYELRRIDEVDKTQ